MNSSETQFFNRSGVIGTAATNNGIRQYTVLDTRNQACMSTTVPTLAIRVAREWADLRDLAHALNIDLEETK